MPHTQAEQTPGQVGAPHPDPEAFSAPAGQGMPTLHEFLTRLVGDPQARSAFEADPSASLQGAGLGDMTATDVLQSASLVLDYAPVEVVQEYGRSLQSSVETFAASTQHVAIKHLDPAQEHGWDPAPEPPREPEPEPAPEPPRDPAPAHEQQEATEPMLHNSGSNSDFSSNGDADEQMPQQPASSGDTNVDINQEQTDSQNLVNVHDVASGNAIGAVGNTVEGVAGGAGSAVGGVGETVGGVADSALGTVDNTADTVGDTADTATGLVGDTADTGTDLVAGAPSAVGDLAGDMTGDAAHLAGGATSALPLDGVL